MFFEKLTETDMSLEQRINYQLNKFPAIKKVIKRCYQRTMYALSPKIKCEGNISRLSPDDSHHEYFFGYYDKSPWDITDRYVLCIRANDTWSDVSPKEKADILLIDTHMSESDDNRVKKIAETNSWNVQQSCMLQWLGPDFSSRIIFNDYRDGKYVSVIKEIATGNERIIPAPIYTVSPDGKVALTLDFSRLYNLRPGYGYYNVPEKTKGIALPDVTAIWKIDLETGNIEPILTYKDFALFDPRPEMQEAKAVHKVNHLMLSPSGERCMVLYRWFVGQRKYTRLVTFNTSDGSDMYVLSDDDMVSHCFWKDDEYILAFANKKNGGPGYYLMKDKTQEYSRCWPQLCNDGHPSYNIDRKLIVTDTYPDRARMAEIKLMDGTNETKNDVKVIARVFAPFKYDNDTRCDLHPRWNHSGNSICFDSVFEGHRGLYSVDVKRTIKRKIRVCFMMTACKKSGPVQQMLNIVKNLDKDIFEPILLTIYKEATDGSSQLEKFLPYVEHFYVPTGKMSVFIGDTGNLKKKLSEINPDVIHSLGVFPDYAISKMKKFPQIITLRNYVWDDYPAKFGKCLGYILAKMHIYAMKHCDKTVACSESLSKLYKRRMKLNYDFICNGVDTSQYTRVMENEKIAIRRKLHLPEKAFIFVYSGQFIERKNQRFLLEVFSYTFNNNDAYLLLLGDGMDYQNLYDKYGLVSNIDFRGSVNDVNTYLKACDAYVSTSKSEGMPNGVLEAMATGLPVVLSDIEQHNEIMKINSGVGFAYNCDDTNDLTRKLIDMMNGNINDMGEEAYKVAHCNFSASAMCKKYQDEYIKLAIG